MLQIRLNINLYQDQEFQLLNYPLIDYFFI